MGRKKQFDENEALEKAMLLIWKKGYEAASTRDIATAMGINQFSLYATFDSKEKLYERALDFYFQQIIQGWLIKPLRVPGGGRDALRQFFEVFVTKGDGTYPTGCMIFNSMTIDAGQRPEVQAIIARYEALITDSFANVLRHDNPQDTDADIEAKASLLLCLMAGIALKKRNGFEGSALQIVVDQTIKSCFPPEISA
jgi:TetR/AcrR family transcriptional regulator, transcriptional repressor for nem operon